MTSPRDPGRHAESARAGAPAQPPAVGVYGLEKTFPGPLRVLDGVDLTIRSGEIFALLGPNGAGKTTLISTICGITRPSAGRIEVDGRDIARDWRFCRARVGLVPQELATDTFETVGKAVAFSRGLFGCSPDSGHLESVLRALSLWEKRDTPIRHLSGGMKRRLLIAKALAHEPSVLFLDEPTAGVDVELRREMWDLIRSLRERGVTVILTTHYIEEAQAMADRVGIIRAGQILLVEETRALMATLGRRTLNLRLAAPPSDVPEALARHGLTAGPEPDVFTCTLPAADDGGETVTGILHAIGAEGLTVRDIWTRESSLEEIVVGLVAEDRA